MFLAHPSPAPIFSGNGEGEVTRVPGDGDGECDDEGVDTSDDGVKGRDLGAGFFFVHEKKLLYLQ